ncbi:ChaN family lipoprotein [Nitrospira moscoviensis]|uniref:Haem-binding uptake Tiki superfamily ChaN domain-containing protein n=1 Tax=Nitrospira moscoviensis TaxID=42253 RepID=A0A0K2G6V1_NITMO|nr:ChaN family lipoprotein [Nitrospira moscoviensis]ALA56701.1 conserved exported protein of unknown function [Nitrospira moscoviensis]
MLVSSWISAARLPALIILVLNLGCSPGIHTVSTASQAEPWQAGQVIETKSGRVVSPAELLKELEQYDIIYIGEEHYNRHHVEAAIGVLSGLLADGFSPVLGMEMFAWDAQPAVDRYLADPGVGRGAFLEQAQWKANWGGEFDNYEPLVTLAQARHLPLRALNPPKALIRRVVKLGLAQARDGDDWKRWGLTEEEIVDDPAYRAKILDQLRRCHGGGAEEDYRTMYEASMVRDEGMAKTLAAAVRDTGRNAVGRRHIVVSYTGGGHIQYNLPVPRRVARRLGGDIRQATVYLTAYDPTRTDDIRELLKEPIADYLWLTPTAGSGPVQRCR